MKKTERTLFISAFTATLAVACFWVIELCQAPSPAKWLGLWCTAAVAGLLAAMRRVCRRYLAAQEEELSTLRQDHAKAVEEMWSRNQAEMEEFRSSLSHSLRMPVSIIQGYAELLTSGVITDEAVEAEYLQKIIQRSQYMTEAISRQFSIADTVDSSKLIYSDLDLIALIRQIVADMQTAAADHGVKIQLVSAEDELPLRADAYLLNRALFNLLENSLKYMGRPGVITIRVLRQDGNVSILVQDDGLGLSTTEVEHIFDPHYQGSNHTSGQGYGLYLVKRTIEGHGGILSAQSAPGRGMGVSMVLPLTPTAAVPDPVL